MGAIEPMRQHEGCMMQRLMVIGVLLAGTVGPAYGQATSPGPTGRVSINVDTVNRSPAVGAPTRNIEISTAFDLESPEITERAGVDFSIDFRQSRAIGGTRPDRLSIYDANAGAHFGSTVQTRVRAGHMWLQDLGTIGQLAGGLVEIGQPRTAEGVRFRVGAFAGREPNVYEMGYVPNVRKVGGYAAIESGFLRRHLVGYTQVRQGALTERSVLSFTNFVPGGQKFFAYQVAEYEVRGVAQGNGPSGLSYFLTNVRVNPTSRLELSGTYNRGRSIDARTLTNDLLSGRALTPRAVDGLRYESRGGRVSVEILRGTRIYTSYTQDRTNRDDALAGRVMVGGYSSNMLRTGFDVAASDSRINRPTGAYHSRFLSVGRSLGSAVYVSMDYSTSLSLIQFQRSDGIVIETRPWTRRYSGSGSVTLNRHVSLLFTADYTKDEAQNEIRALSGLSYRFR
jgi:hypothetical protein